MNEGFIDLRKSGWELCKESPRTKTEYWDLFNYLRKESNKSGAKFNVDQIRLKKEIKVAIRDDVYFSFQRTHLKTARAFCRENLSLFTPYSKKELQWIREWSEELLDYGQDSYKEEEDTPEGTSYPVLSTFKGLPDFDWYLYSIIRGSPPDNIPYETSWTGLLREYPIVVREKIKIDKIKYMREFLSRFPEADEALQGVGNGMALANLNTEIVEQYELRNFWTYQIWLPRLYYKEGAKTIENFVEKEGRQPTLKDDLSPYINKEFKENHGPSILREVTNRIRKKLFSEMLSNLTEKEKEDIADGRSSYFS